MCAVVGEEVVRIKKIVKREEDEDEENKKENKRRKEWSEIRLAIEELSLVQHDQDCDNNDKVFTLPFLTLSNLLLQVIDKIGPTMAVLRHDIQRNIERLEDIYVSDPSSYSTMMEIVEKEVNEGTARKTDSCARALLWLTRSMDFSAALLEKLDGDSKLSLAEMVDGAYSTTLKPHYGWISSAAYKVALKLIPERKIFTSLLMSKGQDYDNLKSDIHNLLTLLVPLLTQSHAILKKFNLDTFKSK